MTLKTTPSLEEDGRALDRQLAVLEANVYRSLAGLVEDCERIAVEADDRGLVPQGIRARLLASDVRSRLGESADARAEQLALREAAWSWPMLAGRAAVYLASSCIRLGLRIEATRWVEASVGAEEQAELPAWRAEALMVAALFAVSRQGADYTLADQALAAVRAACAPVMVAATAANFAEVASECGELIYASHYADEAEATMRRHPEAAAALSWESVARARLACGELHHAERWLAEHSLPAGRGVDAQSDTLCVAVADLDHFKRIDDTHSHEVGDLVLQRVGNFLLNAFDSSLHGIATPRLVARLGGEEFLLAWSGIPIDTALRLSNELGERLRQTSCADLLGPTPVTASIGLVCGLRPVDPGDLLRAADERLYEAKRAGRDRVVGPGVP
jgi:diguanylate cyclase (GGDEF)-like protein